jgi:hypothetical protein
LVKNQAKRHQRVGIDTDQSRMAPNPDIKRKTNVKGRGMNQARGAGPENPCRFAEEV